MKRLRIILLAPACFILGIMGVKAQGEVSDSSMYATALTNTLAVYHDAVATQSPIVNGRQYKPYSFTFIKEGHPFFETNQFVPATVYYEDQFYDNVKILYDVHLDMVIMDAGVRVELISERLPQFSISGHQFFRIPADTVHQAINEGYYERLYDGGIQLFKKEYKEFKEVLSVTEGYQAEIIEKYSYFIKKGDQFYRVKNKDGLLNILKEKRNEVEKYLKTNRLNFRKDKQNTITKAVIYYDQLTRSR